MLINAAFKVANLRNVKPKGSHLQEPDDRPNDKHTGRPVFTHTGKKRSEAELLADVWRPEEFEFQGRAIKKRSRSKPDNEQSETRMTEAKPRGSKRKTIRAARKKKKAIKQD